MVVVQKEGAVQVSVSEAKAQLTELVRRAEAGEDVVLTRHGRPTVRLAPLPAAGRGEDLETLFQHLQAEVAALKLPPGPSAARSADFLYDDDGLPA